MFGNDWDEVLKSEIEKPYFTELLKKVREEYDKKTIYPKIGDVFRAFRLTPYEKVKVVILGQDPYHGVDQAEGLSFSVKDTVAKPPSLQNIFKELKDDLGYDIPESGSLISWAENGVLLLNAILTVEADKAASHRDFGWEAFTDHVIQVLNEKETPVVFILWGSFARNKKKYITNDRHLVLESVHPSPLSVYNGFFGSKPFSKTNEFLENNGIEGIDWKLKR